MAVERSDRQGQSCGDLDPPWLQPAPSMAKQRPPTLPSQFQKSPQKTPPKELLTWAEELVSSSTASPRTFGAPSASSRSGSDSASSFGSPRSKLWARRKGNSGNSLGLQAPVAPFSPTSQETLSDLLKREGYTFPKVIGRSANSGTTVMSATKLPGGTTGKAPERPPLQTNIESVALKCVYERRHEGSLRETLRKEFQILQRLKHPSVVKAATLIDMDAALCMEMNLCEGMLLARVFPDWGPGTMLEAMTSRGMLFGEIASALVYLHDKCVAHRDLHAENIIVNFLGQDADSDSNVKVPRITIVDFGCAREIDGVASTVGTAFLEDMNTLILPPENVLLSADAFGCDIFALGLLGAGLVSGRVTLPKHVWKGSQLVLPRVPDERYALPPALASYLEGLLSLTAPVAASARAVQEAMPPPEKWLSFAPQRLSL